MTRKMEPSQGAVTGQSPSPLWSDQAFCRLIFDLRTKNGACSLGDLSRATGQSRQAIDERLKTLERRGLVMRTRGVWSSIRTTDEKIWREGHRPT